MLLLEDEVIQTDEQAKELESRLIINPCQKVRDSCRKVIEQSTKKFVTINQESVVKFKDSLKEKLSNGQGFSYDKWSDWHIDNPRQYTLEQVTTYCFVVDAMNFCFWPDSPKAKAPLPKQQTEFFEYENITRNLESILKEDPAFFTCERLI